MNKVKQVVVVLALAVLLSGTLAAQDGLSAIGKAFSAANVAKSKLERLQEVLQEIEKGKPRKHLSNWSTIADNFKTATVRLNKLRVFGPTVLEPVPTERINGQDKTCNKDTEIAYYGPMFDDQYQKRIEEMKRDRDGLDEHIKDASELSAVLDEIAKLYVKLSQTPDFGEIFQYDWLTIETDVRANLSEYESALKLKRKEFDEVIRSAQSRFDRHRQDFQSYEADCDDAATRAWQKKVREQVEEQQRLAEAQKAKEAAEKAAQVEKERHAAAEKAKKAQLEQHARDCADVSGSWIWVGNGAVFTITQSGNTLTFQGPPYFGSGTGMLQVDRFDMTWPRLNASYTGALVAYCREIGWNNGVTWRKQ
jgi:hypothetical protein